MNNASFNYVRAFRQKHGLTARELTFLLGHRSHTVLAKVEAGERLPSLRTAFCLQVIFRRTPHRVLPALYEAAEDDVMRRVATLLGRLERKTDIRSVAKREYLEGLAEASAEHEV